MSQKGGEKWVVSNIQSQIAVCDDDAQSCVLTPPPPNNGGRGKKKTGCSLVND